MQAKLLYSAGRPVRTDSVPAVSSEHSSSSRILERGCARILRASGIDSDRRTELEMVPDAAWNALHSAMQGAVCFDCSVEDTVRLVIAEWHA